MPARPHLYFKNPTEGVVNYKQRSGGGSKEEAEKEPDYSRMAQQFEISLASFHSARTKRHNNRTIPLPIHFDLIELEFQAYFDQPLYEQAYYNDFGLALVHVSRFNRKGLFIIDDGNKFRQFFNHIQVFIKNIQQQETTSYHPNIRFIRAFKLYSSEDMIRSVNNYDTLHFDLISYSLREEFLINPQKEALGEYFREQGISYQMDGDSLEVYNASKQLLDEVINNFDIIYATCSGSGAIIRPDTFNTPLREFGFTITNAEEKLPIIGVIDTGVSNQTPLKSVITDGANEYDLTGTGAYFDHVDHGTGVACLAALGEQLIPNYRGEVLSDAKILSIKILDEQRAPISQSQIVKIIRKAYKEKGVRIFTLTVGYTDFPLFDNQEYSSYAMALDQLAYELDILIFISTTNNCSNITDNCNYPNKLLDEDANIAPPAESMNNITVGAIADNFEDGSFTRRSGLKTFPTIYTRKFHYDFDADIFNNNTSNKHLFKPDILMAGGDYEQYFFMGVEGFEDRGTAALEVLSSNLQERTHRCIGTSYAAPLAANLGAKIQKQYPAISMQSVKALIVNSAQKPDVKNFFEKNSKSNNRRVFGHGTPDQSKLIFSDENQVTLLLEDSITPGEIKCFPLKIPEYLINAKRKIGLLKLNATLCFKFNPVSKNQLLYCPLHIGFSISRNLPLSNNNGTSINGSSKKEISLNSSSDAGWSQDYYYKAKVVSNTQKVTLSLSKDCLISENNTLKIAVNSAFHKLLSGQDKIGYQKPTDFSLALNIEQYPKKSEVLGDLYNELVAVNTLESIAGLEGDLEVGLDV